jgi:hypothetical protein
MPKKWIKKAIRKPGALHRALHVPRSKRIPASKLRTKSTDSTVMKRRKALARTLARLRRRKR